MHSELRLALPKKKKFGQKIQTMWIPLIVFIGFQHSVPCQELPGVGTLSSADIQVDKVPTQINKC